MVLFFPLEALYPEPLQQNIKTEQLSTVENVHRLKELQRPKKAAEYEIPDTENTQKSVKFLLTYSTIRQFILNILSNS